MIKNIIEYSVSEINNMIKDLISNVYTEKININGEISNMKISAGNLFFTLKDENCSINITSWGYTKNKNVVDIKNGDKAIVTGKINFYPKNGNTTVNASHIETIGLGQIYNNYENMKMKFQENGYFNTHTKKLLVNTARVGILTAIEGAALQDILYVLKNNNFCGKIIVKGCVVQGTSCAKSICDGIDYLTEWKDCNGKLIDVILMARGGGSFEDLIGFSDPQIIEKIYACNICTISAIGHEIDFMLSDFVADIRAPTPSIAAELLCSKQKIYNDKILNDNIFLCENIKYQINNNIQNIYLSLDSLYNKLQNPVYVIDAQIKELDIYQQYMMDIFYVKKTLYNSRLDEITKYIDKHDINKLLNDDRVLLTKNGKICYSIDNLSVQQKLKIKFKNGEADIVITKIKYNK